MSVRTEKVGSEIKKALGQPLNEFAASHGGGMITITGVKMSPDLSIASLNISVFANSYEQTKLLQALENERFRFKRVLSTAVRLRIMPELRFYIDDSLDAMDRITAVLKANPPFQPVGAPPDSEQENLEEDELYDDGDSDEHTD